MASQTTSAGPSPGHFPTTRWSRVILAGDPDAPLARESLAELCSAYWYPLYAYIRRRGHGPEQARDLTQDFFARALEKGLLAEADPARGRFRSFLRTVCAHFLANRHDHDQRRKRGGGRTTLPIDANTAEGRYALELADGLTPERIFDRSWVLTLLGRVLDQLGREYDEAGKTATFEALRSVLAWIPTEGKPVNATTWARRYLSRILASARLVLLSSAKNDRRCCHDVLRNIDRN